MELSKLLKKSIEENAFSAISTYLSNGDIQTHLMWIDYRDNYLLINTEQNRKKTENIRANSKISLVVFHPTSMYSSWEIRGEVVRIVEDQSANEHIDKLSKRYTGKPYRRDLDEKWDPSKIKNRELWYIQPNKIIPMIRPQAKLGSE